MEGPVVVAEALRCNAAIEELFVVPGSSEEIEDLASRRNVPVHRVSDQVLASLADTATPQGVVARVGATDVTLDELELTTGLVVVLADVRDPGNSGTLMRSALAAGADGVVSCTGSVDPLHPKTVRASAGAIFRIPLVRNVDVDAASGVLRSRGLVILGADQKGVGAYATDLSRPLALIVGNEAWGLAPAVRAVLDAMVAIPMPGPAESLNAGIAGSLLLFEALRQRASVYPRKP